MILVTGANGFVGHKIMELRSDVIAAPTLRNASEEDIRRIVSESDADIIVHTAAISDIGVCQANPDDSYRANVLLPVYLARAAQGRKLICFSSDQVYSGSTEEGPYTEQDVCPGNIYAQHKLEMEQRVLDLQPDAVMLRAEWMYDMYMGKPNYFMNLLRAESAVSFSSGQYRGITYLREVVENLDRVTALPGGAYNFGSETALSMYEITRQFVRVLGKQIPVLDAPARHNLWMDCSKAAWYGVVFRDVSAGLELCAGDYGLLR